MADVKRARFLPTAFGQSRTYSIPQQRVPKGNRKPIEVCCYCCGDERQNRKSLKPEDMIACAECGLCAHGSCLQMSTSLFDTVKRLRWQCLNCKRCAFCYKKDRGGQSDNDLLLCDGCDRGFHTSCLDPPLTQLPDPDAQWRCEVCDPPSDRSPRPLAVDDTSTPSFVIHRATPPKEPSPPAAVTVSSELLMEKALLGFCKGIAWLTCFPVCLFVFFTSFVLFFSMVASSLCLWFFLCLIVSDLLTKRDQ